MRALDAITECDRIKPNEYSQNIKRKWINKIESDIREHIALHSEKNADMSFVEDDNPVLCLDDRFSDIYVYYLISMIDMSNQEYQMYNNSASYFNYIFLEWKKQHRRRNLPAKNIPLKY